MTATEESAQKPRLGWDNLIDFEKLASKMADDRMAGPLTQQERSFLENQKNRLTGAVVALREAIINRLSDDERDRLLALLWDSVVSSFFIGGHFVNNPITDRIRREINGRRAAHAREAKRSKLRAREIDEIIAREAASLPASARPGAVAKQIRPVVEKALTAIGLKPLGQRAIANRIARSRSPRTGNGSAPFTRKEGTAV